MFSQASNYKEKGHFALAPGSAIQENSAWSPVHLPPCTVHRLSASLPPFFFFLPSSSFLSFSPPPPSSLPSSQELTILRGKNGLRFSPLYPPQPSHHHPLALNFLVPVVSSTSEITGSFCPDTPHDTGDKQIQPHPISPSLPQHENLSSMKRTGLILPNPTSQAEPPLGSWHMAPCLPLAWHLDPEGTDGSSWSLKYILIWFLRSVLLLLQGEPESICCCLVTKSYLTLCNPMECSLPDPSVHGISQARTLEWVAISFSRGSSWPREGLCLLHLLHWQVGSLPLSHQGCPESAYVIRKDPKPTYRDKRGWGSCFL